MLKQHIKPLDYSYNDSEETATEVPELNIDEPKVDKSFLKGSSEPIARVQDIQVAQKELDIEIPEIKQAVTDKASIPVSTQKTVQKSLSTPESAKATIDKLVEVDKAAKNPLIFVNKYMGLHEDNPEHQDTIKGFMDAAVPGWVKKGSDMTKDSFAWCAALVNNVLNEGGFGQLEYGNDRFNLIRARQYSNIGEPTSLDKGKPGDIIVVKDKSTNGYHVAFYAGEKNGVPLMMGGNQNDQVNIKEVDTDSLDIVSMRRLKNVEDLDKESLNKILDTKYYIKKGNKLNTR